MLYTDGVTEARNRTGAEYGLDRLLELLSSRHGLAARDVAAVISQDLDNFRSERSREKTTFRSWWCAAPAEFLLSRRKYRA